MGFLFIDSKWMRLLKTEYTKPTFVQKLKIMENVEGKGDETNPMKFNMPTEL